MSEGTIILLLSLYAIVGFFVSLHLYATRDDYGNDEYPTVKEGMFWLVLFAPEYGLLALTFWPLYLAIRIYRLITNKDID